MTIRLGCIKTCNVYAFACLECSKGHRASNCTHVERILLRRNKPGRPPKKCNHGDLDRCLCNWQRMVCTTLTKAQQKAVLDGERIRVEMYRSEEQLINFVSYHTFLREKEGLEPLYSLRVEDRKPRYKATADDLNDESDSKPKKAGKKPKSKAAKAKAKHLSETKAANTISSNVSQPSSPTDAPQSPSDISAPVSASAPNSGAVRCSCKGHGQPQSPNDAATIPSLSATSLSTSDPDPLAAVPASDPSVLGEWAQFCAARGYWVTPGIDMTKTAAWTPGTSAPMPDTESQMPVPVQSQSQLQFHPHPPTHIQTHLRLQHQADQIKSENHLQLQHQPDQSNPERHLQSQVFNQSQVQPLDFQSLAQYQPQYPSYQARQLYSQPRLHPQPPAQAQARPQPPPHPHPRSQAQPQLQLQTQVQTQLEPNFFVSMLAASADPVFSPAPTSEHMWTQSQSQSPGGNPNNGFDTLGIGFHDSSGWLTDPYLDPVHTEDQGMKDIYAQLTAAIAAEANADFYPLAM